MPKNPSPFINLDLKKPNQLLLMCL